MSIIQGIRGSFNLFGCRGVVLTSTNRLVGWPKEIKTSCHGACHPVHLRLRTSDVSVYSDILLRDAYELELRDFQPRTIVDVGANVGLASVYFANRYPSAKIIALEPEPSNFAVLVKNVAPYRTITSVNAALWKEDTQVHVGVESDDAGKWAFKVVPAGGSQVRGVTMQTLMRETGLGSIDLLKVDIEGGEKEVFESCDWLQSVKVMIIELHDRILPGCRDSVTAAANGFQICEKGEMTLYVRVPS
jgi:FkbM family methyltransferase